MNIVLATNNKNKLVEMRSILGNAFENIYSLADLNIDVDVDETADTFEGNAILKAREICKIANMPALADDSGLIVDALDGAPGVYSARYAGEHGDDEKNNDKLLANMDGVQRKDRTCRFLSAMAICYPDGKCLTAEGVIEGYLLEERDGTSGFGYDPLFYSIDLAKSFGVATSEEKNSVSHRSRGLKSLLEKI